MNEGLGELKCRRHFVLLTIASTISTIFYVNYIILLMPCLLLVPVLPYLFYQSNTTIYGDTINEQGQWVVDGVVQTKMINYEFEDPFTGETVDAREEFGYKGLMSFINDLGIDAITNVYSKEKFKEVCGMLYYYALKEDINRIGDIVYGDDDNQKAALEAEALQYQTGG